MKFSSEEERIGHPQAGLIPYSLWFKHYNETFSEEDARVFAAPLEELRSHDYGALPYKQRAKTCVSLLVSHRKEQAEDLWSFAKETLMLSIPDIFDYAVTLGHTGILEKIAAEITQDKLQEMIANGKFYAFRLAAQNGHLKVLRYLEEKAPDKLQEMIAADRFLAFQWAAENCHLKVLRYLEEKAPKNLQKMIAADGFKAFRWAAINGHLEVLRYLEKKAPDKLQEMIAADTFDAFRRAAINGHLEVLRYLEEKAPGKLQEMIAADVFQAFQLAAQNGHLEVLRYLEEKAKDNLQEMIAANGFQAFQGAALKGHLEVLRYLEEKAPGKLQEMIAADGFLAFRWAAVNGHIHIINHLLNYAYTYNYAEMHYHERNYQDPVTEHTLTFLDALQNDLTAFQYIHPNGVFDFASGDPAADAHRALYGYYVLRHLIRQLGENRFGDGVFASISRLLEIPSIKTLLLHNTTETHLPAGHPLGVFAFAKQRNELLRLAMNAGDERVSQLLLAIPAVRAQAELNDFYRGAAGLDLRALAEDRESSMTGLTPQEQEQVRGIEKAYQQEIEQNPQGVLGVIATLREDLKQRFLAEENLAKRQATLSGETLTLPFEYEAFLKLVDEHDADIQKLSQIYYQNIYHSAWRYLTKPNPWMAPNASYVYINDDRTERWSTFEEYQPFIAYLYLAAKDKSSPPPEKNVTTQDRINLFFAQLSLINRAHNWDKSRVVQDSEGKPRVNKEGKPITEEYDDGRGDCPSCFSGVKRRLFQSLLSHPLYMPLNDTIMRQFIREEIRAHYLEKLKEYSLADLQTLKANVDDIIFDIADNEPTQEIDLLKGLRWEGEDEIKIEMQGRFKERAVPFYSLIHECLYPDKKENTFISKW